MPKPGVRLALLVTFLISTDAYRTVAQQSAKVGEAALIEAENEVSARKTGKWEKGVPGLPLSIGDGVRTGEFSRATVRLTDLSAFRMDELTTVEIPSPKKLSGSAGLNIRQGAI